MPLRQAIQPACRPIVSMTMIRRCDSAVVRSRSTASMTMLMAVSKPNVKSVADRSLSMVLGTPTIGSFSSCEEPGGDAQRVVAADGDQGVESEPREVLEAAGDVGRAACRGWCATSRGWCRRGR